MPSQKAAPKTAESQPFWQSTARTDFTSKCGLLLSEQGRKIFWQRCNGKLHFRQRILATPSFYALLIKLKKRQRNTATLSWNYDKGHFCT
jgi:hypothetical protein